MAEGAVAALVEAAATAAHGQLGGEITLYVTTQDRQNGECYHEKNMS
jgi:hypothetical protein